MMRWGLVIAWLLVLFATTPVSAQSVLWTEGFDTYPAAGPPPAASIPPPSPWTNIGGHDSVTTEQFQVAPNSLAVGRGGFGDENYRSLTTNVQIGRMDFWVYQPNGSCFGCAVQAAGVTNSGSLDSDKITIGLSPEDDAGSGTMSRVVPIVNRSFIFAGAWLTTSNTFHHYVLDFKSSAASDGFLKITMDGVLEYSFVGATATLSTMDRFITNATLEGPLVDAEFYLDTIKIGVGGSGTFVMWEP